MKDINTIKQKIAPILKEMGISQSFIFGSYARKEQKTGSDLDLIVEIGKNKSLLDLVVLKLRLEKELGIKIDILTADSVHPEINKSIMKERIQIL
jgi:uncharacterized protein